jgi:hypothetical protein
VGISDLSVTASAINNLEYNCHHVSFLQPKKCKSVRFWNWFWDSLFCVHIFHFCFIKSSIYVCNLYNYQYFNKSKEVVNLLLKARSCSQQMLHNSHSAQRQTRLEGVAMMSCMIF